MSASEYVARCYECGADLPSDDAKCSNCGKACSECGGEIVADGEHGPVCTNGHDGMPAEGRYIMGVFEEDVFAALDRTWMDVHEIARATKARPSRFEAPTITYSVAAGSGWETVLDRLVEHGFVEAKKVSPVEAPLGKKWRRAL